MAQVQVYGSQKYAVRIQLDPQALASRSIGMDEVSTAVDNGSVNLPTGILWGTDKAYAVQSNGQLDNAAEFGALIVAYRDGAPVRLRDLGRVIDSVQDTKQASWFNGQRAIVLAIQRQPGTNTVAVSQRVKAEVAKFQPSLPPSVELATLYDRSQSIEQSVSDVKFTLFLALCLVVMVIFLFLRNIRATLIPSLALPMSLVGTFAVMYLLGYSLDNLSLMALTLAVGFVVDDAIVVLENIVRHIERGESVMEAALKGSREISFTVISMTLSLVAVFIPVLLLGGLIGRLFQEFAVTIAVAILVSGFVSLTLTPMLCSRWLKPGSESGPHGRLYQVIERMWEGSLAAYERSLVWVMDRRGLAMAFSALILIGTVLLGRAVPKGFIPSEDQGQLFGTTETAEGTSFDNMVEHQRAAAAIVQDDPNVEGFMSAVGGGGGRTTNQGRLLIHLKPRGDRPLGADDVARSLTQKLAVVPGLRVFLNNPPVINIGGRSSKSQYQFTLQSSDIGALYQAAGTMEQKLHGVKGVTDVTSDLQIKNPEIQVSIDRDRAASLGIDANTIESALYDAYGARQVGTIFTPNDQYWVVMELLPQYQRDLARAQPAVHHRPKRCFGAARLSRAGDAVRRSADRESLGPDPLGDPLVQPRSGHLARHGGHRRPESGAPDPAIERQHQLCRHGAGLPGGATGAARAPGPRDRGDLPRARHPVRELHPPAHDSVGASVRRVRRPAGALHLPARSQRVRVRRHHHADRHREEERDHDDRLCHRSRTEGRKELARLDSRGGERAIPADHDDDGGGTDGNPADRSRCGAGAESRRPLGVAVVGGLAFSQLITLYITPVVYTYLDAFQHWVGRRKEREVVEPRGSEQAASPARAVDSEPVQRLVLCFERPNQRPMVGRRPRHDFDELGRRVPRALAVDPLPEPAHQESAVAASELLVDVAQLELGLREELGREDVTQRVRGEVAEQPVGPVTVLQTALRVVPRPDSECSPVRLVPRLRHLRGPQVPRDERALELEADEDVEVVGDFVGIGADERPAHAIEREEKIARRRRRRDSRETGRAPAGRSTPRIPGSGRCDSPRIAPAIRPSPPTVPHPSVFRSGRDRGPARRARVPPRGESSTLRRRSRGRRSAR